MASLNQCNFIGNLGGDPEIRYTPNGKAVTNFSIAVTEKYKDEKKTEWVKCVAWGRLAEVIAEYLKKGSSIFISGRLQTRSWEDQNGNKRYTTEVVANQMQMLGGGQKNTPASDGGVNTEDVPEQDIPF